MHGGRHDDREEVPAPRELREFRHSRVTFAALEHPLNRSTTLDGLVEPVLGAWKGSFELSPQALDAARPVAQRFAEQAAQIPSVDPSLDTGARRQLGMKRMIAVIHLQAGMEKELASLAVLSDEERARVQQGSSEVLDLRLKK